MEEDITWILVAAVSGRANDGTAGGVGGAAESFGDGNVEGGNDGTGDGGLGLVCNFLRVVDDLRIPCGASSEAEGTVLSWVGRVHPRCGRFEGVLDRLFGEAAEAPFLRLGGLEGF